MRRRFGGRQLFVAAVVSVLIPGAALACDLTPYYKTSSGKYVLPAYMNWKPGRTAASGRTVRSAPSPCPPDANDQDPMTHPDKVITGQFGQSQQGQYVMLPFDVPAGTTAVRVRYCYDQPDLRPPGGLPISLANTLDLGLYDSRSGPTGFWGRDQFRGWGGSSHPDVTVSPNGYSSEADYLAHRKTHVFGKTTRGFEPGPIPAGQWAAELGVASVVPQSEGNLDGKVDWRVEIGFSSDPGYADAPYQPAPYDTTPANPNPGWYTGDLHVHAEHSSLGDATYRHTFDDGFRPLSQGGAGLDFITASDYVTDSGWGELGRYQADYPGKLIERSAEVITYHGHTNNHGSHTFADYRTGEILERHDDGSLTELRGPTPPSRIFDEVHAAGGWTQINHPTIFPSAVPGFSSFCRGCPWDYSDAETDYSKVDAIEVQTGPAGLKVSPFPGPNPFTPLALLFYEHALDTGAHIAAVGVSDTHHAGDLKNTVTDPTGSFIGQASTAVYAPELSEQGVEQAVKAGHTYVKIFGADGPDLRFEARPAGSSAPPAIMGDTVHADSVNFTAKVLGAGPSAVRPGPYVLLVFKDGLPYLAAPVTGDDFNLNFSSLGAGRYRLQVMRFGGVAAIEDVSSPIYVAPSGPPPATSADLAVHQSDARDPVLRGNHVIYTATVHNSGPDPAQHVELSDVLPQGFGFVSAHPDAGSCSETTGVLNCDLGDLASGADAKVTIAVSADQVGRAGNVAIVHSATVDPRGDDNNSTEATRVLERGSCANRLSGDDHRNRLIGTFAGDEIIGHRGRDVIKGGAGHDCLNGNRGNDRIYAVDGKRDLVTCGLGHRDYARVDRHDVVRGCEHVRHG